jgi:hypothetical protein
LDENADEDTTRYVSLRASMVEAWREEMLKAGVGKSPVRKALIVMGRLYRFGKRDHYRYSHSDDRREQADRALSQRCGRAAITRATRRTI